MTAALVAVAVVAVAAAAAAVAGWRRARVERHRADTATRAAADARSRAGEAEARASAAGDELGAALSRAASAERRAAEVEAAAAAAPPGPAGTAVLDAVWALQRLDAERARRRTAALSTAAPGQAAPGTLAAALEDEVERLREETGTPGTLRVDLEAQPAPGDAVLAVRAVQSLLGVLGRHCQGYDLYLHRFDARLLAVLVCDDFDGPDAAADEAAELLEALAPADGRLELDRDERGRLRARLSLPLG